MSRCHDVKNPRALTGVVAAGYGHGGQANSVRDDVLGTYVPAPFIRLANGRHKRNSGEGLHAIRMPPAAVKADGPFASVYFDDSHDTADANWQERCPPSAPTFISSPTFIERAAYGQSPGTALLCCHGAWAAFGCVHAPLRWCGDTPDR